MPKVTAGATGSVQVLFVQGGGKDTHDAWDDKLVASLRRALGSGYGVDYPRMPDEDRPDAAAWKRAIARALAKLGDAPILVGHSVGGAILVDHLARTATTRRDALSSTTTRTRSARAATAARSIRTAATRRT